MNLDELNSLAAAAAIGEFLRCCGSGRWATAMTAARPFQTFDDVLSTADAIWTALDQPDWLEAFEAHPKIGETGTAGWSTREQAGVAAATTDVRDRLAAANRKYEARFGYIFIVCATGKSAYEVLDLLHDRLHNDTDTELRAAADEQRKITRLRLAKLLAAERLPTT